MLAFLRKNPSLTTEEFINYYETKHIPLIVSVSGDTLPTTYKRRYFHQGKAASATEAFGVLHHPSDGSSAVPYDAVTELGFPDKQASETWVAKMRANEAVVADELVFLDQRKMSLIVVQEFETIREQ